MKGKRREGREGKGRGRGRVREGKGKKRGKKRQAGEKQKEERKGKFYYVTRSSPHLTSGLPALGSIGCIVPRVS